MRKESVSGEEERGRCAGVGGVCEVPCAEKPCPSMERGVRTEHVRSMSSERVVGGGRGRGVNA